MSVLFSVAVYLVAGLGVIVFLGGRGRLPSGAVVRIAAVVFWPAYLPVCLEPRRSPAAGPLPEWPSGGVEGAALLQGVAEQLERLPITAARKEEHRASLGRLAAMVARRAEERARLEKAEARLRALAEGLAEQDRQLAEPELARVRAAKARVESELGRAREGAVRIALRLEALDVHSAVGALDVEVASLEEEIGRLLEARGETELLAAAPRG